MATRRQAASQRHTAAANRHVKVIVSLLPAPIPRAVPPRSKPAEDVHLPHPKQSLDDTDQILQRAQRRAKRQVIVDSSRARRRAARRVVVAEQKAKLVLTRQMNLRENRAALRLNRKKTIRTRVVSQVNNRHSAGVTHRSRTTNSVSKMAVKATSARQAVKARTARLWTFNDKDDINLLGGLLCLS